MRNNCFFLFTHVQHTLVYNGNVPKNLFLHQRVRHIQHQFFLLPEFFYILIVSGQRRKFFEDFLHQRVHFQLNLVRTLPTTVRTDLLLHQLSASHWRVMLRINLAKYSLFCRTPFAVITFGNTVFRRRRRSLENFGLR